MTKLSYLCLAMLVLLCLLYATVAQNDDVGYDNDVGGNDVGSDDAGYDVGYDDYGSDVEYDMPDQPAQFRIPIRIPIRIPKPRIPKKPKPKVGNRDKECVCRKRKCKCYRP